MLKIGQINTLKVLKKLDFGLYLDGGNMLEILLPTRYIPAGTEVGHTLDVFIHYDSEDRLIATTEAPFVHVGECAALRVSQVGQYGAFLDWGLPKDLFVPFAEQRVPMEEGKTYVVYVFLDNTSRIAASSRLSDHLEEEDFADFTVGQAVKLLVAARTDLGHKAVIDGTHLGLIHKNEAFKTIRVGDVLTGYVKNIRPDDRIDLTLQPIGIQAKDDLSEAIIAYLSKNGGTSRLTDKAPPEKIYQTFNVSKANYKKALGKLYKEKRIALDKDKITLK